MHLSMKLLYRTVLFDFDGTLCASGEGITFCVALALREMGRPVPPPEILRRFVGPPAQQAYQEYCGMSYDEGEEAVQRFRVHYNGGGWKKSAVYPGIPDLLCSLRAAGATVATASSKPQNMVEQMLEHFQIRSCFQVVSAADDNGGDARKSDVIRRALAQCGETSLPDAVMVGDTHFDAEGAAEVGVPFVGAAYGYGGEADLRAGGAETIAASVAELQALLLDGICRS